MSTDTLAQLQALDPAVLADVVRQDQRCPTFEITDWTVQPMNHAPALDTTGGLFHFSGRGRDESSSRPWSVVLKVVNNPKPWAQDEDDIGYWKRELLINRSDVLTNLPNALRAPRCYGVTEHDDGGWIWMEHIAEPVNKRWTLEDFHQAARRIGHFGGAYLCGVALPDYPWLNHSFFHRFLADGDWWATVMDPTSASSAWQHPLVQRAFNESLKSRTLNVLADKAVYSEANDRLPRVLCHYDLHRRNLMLPLSVDGSRDLVALDWAICGLGAIGNDLGELVAMSTWYFDSDPGNIATLDTTCFDEYVAGTRDAGWTGDPRLIRLGYLISTTIWQGVTLPGWVVGNLNPGSEERIMEKFGHTTGEVLAGWVTLAEFWLDRADEARRLMRKLEFV